jgi:hypothetical protein
MALVTWILLSVAVLLWLALIGTVFSMNDSDPAGNGLSYAFSVLMTIGLWVLLAILMILAGSKGVITGWTKVTALVLVPASAAAALSAIHLASSFTGLRWTLIIPVLVPALVIIFVLWAILPGFHIMVSSRIAGGVTWGAILLLTLAPLPAARAKSRAAAKNRAAIDLQAAADLTREQEQRQQENLATFAKLKPDSPLWEWMPFTFDSNPLRDTALAGARNLVTRQEDAEALLERGHWFPLVEIEHLDLHATPRFCELARQHLDKEALAWRTTAESPPEYSVSVGQLEKYHPAIEWLTDRHCNLDSALATTIQTIQIYPASPERDRYLAELVRLKQASHQ